MKRSVFQATYLEKDGTRQEKFFSAGNEEVVLAYLRETGHYPLNVIAVKKTAGEPIDADAAYAEHNAKFRLKLDLLEQIKRLVLAVEKAVHSADPATEVLAAARQVQTQWEVLRPPSNIVEAVVLEVLEKFVEGLLRHSNSEELRQELFRLEQGRSRVQDRARAGDPSAKATARRLEGAPSEFPGASLQASPMVGAWQQELWNQTYRLALWLMDADKIEETLQQEAQEHEELCKRVRQGDAEAINSLERMNIAHGEVEHGGRLLKGDLAFFVGQGLDGIGLIEIGLQFSRFHLLCELGTIADVRVKGLFRKKVVITCRTGKTIVFRPTSGLSGEQKVFIPRLARIIQYEQRRKAET